MYPRTTHLLAAFCLICLLAGSASGSASASAGSAAVFADYVSELKDYWGKLAGQQSGVVMVALGTGVVALLIITQIKGNKK